MTAAATAAATADATAAATADATADATALAAALDDLEPLRARGTTLVTLLLPQGASLDAAAQRMVAETSEAGNIKCRQTRRDVLAALGWARALLQDAARGDRKTCGHALFAGCATLPGGGQRRV
jgi:peptide chain release factor subunit 1